MSLEGVLLIDKPKGPSSFEVVRRVRALTGQKRVGHAGTLDPLASGLMVVAVGRYTKLCSYLTEASKVYETIIELGVTTTTDDQEGEVLQRKPIDHLSEEETILACQSFKGVISQQPPKFSAVKINGRRAYSMARALEPFELPLRSVEIFDIVIKEVALPYVVLSVHCSKGTYIRSLARDIGDFLQVGAYARAIRRFRSGSFDVELAEKLDDLDKQSLPLKLLSKKAALGGMDAIDISLSDRENAIHGRPLRMVYPHNKASVAFYEDNPVAIVVPDCEKTRVARVL